MNKYKYFANPINDLYLPVITTNNINSFETITDILKSRNHTDDYKIETKPSSKIIQVCNGYKELKIKWLNLTNNKIEEDVYIIKKTTRIRYFSSIINSFIGVRFDIKEFKNSIFTNCFEEYCSIFCQDISYKDEFSSEAVVESIEELFNKSNHCLSSTKLTNISQVSTCFYKDET